MSSVYTYVFLLTKAGRIYSQVLMKAPVSLSHSNVPFLTSSCLLGTLQQSLRDFLGPISLSLQSGTQTIGALMLLTCPLESFPSSA